MNKEIWKDVIGYEGLYQVSNLGRVKSLIGWNGKKYINRERILKLSLKNEPYNYHRYKVSLKKNKLKKDFSIHRLVAIAFIPNPLNKPQINHKDGNHLNNHVENLEWCTAHENIIHSYKFLRKTKYDVSKIINDLNNNIQPKIIIEKYKISYSILQRIVKQNNIVLKGTSYWLNKYNIDLNELLEDFKKGLSNKELVKKYNCSKDIIATRKYKFKKEGKIL